jgi:hypothetical protein
MGMVQIGRLQGNTFPGHPGGCLRHKLLHNKELRQLSGTRRPEKVLPGFEPCRNMTVPDFSNRRHAGQPVARTAAGSVEASQLKTSSSAIDS